jgi:diaminopimelate epimerase
MGRPRLTRAEIPMTGEPTARTIEETVDVAGRPTVLTTVSMGNPHAITFVSESGAALRALAEKFGPSLENHALFPRRTNAEFARVISPTHIELVVWERGCGITLACGTGACATAVAACLTGRASPGTEIRIDLLGGPLAITVAPDYTGVTMRGPARLSFEGAIDLRSFLSA